MQVDPEVLRATQEFAQAAEACWLCVYCAGHDRGHLWRGARSVRLVPIPKPPQFLKPWAPGMKTVRSEGIAVDVARKVVSTPAYMLAHSPLDAEKGITRLVNQVLDWV